MAPFSRRVPRDSESCTATGAVVRSPRGGRERRPLKALETQLLC